MEIMPQFMELNYHHGTGFSKIYTKFPVKRTTVNAWKGKFKKDFPSLVRKKGKPNLEDDEMLQKIGDVIYSRITFSGSSNISKNVNYN